MTSFRMTDQDQEGRSRQPRKCGMDQRDLGFGTAISGRTGTRLLNRDGDFNVRRRPRRVLFTYHYFLTIPWWRFHLLLIATYLSLNSLFALAYLACGPGALRGTDGTSGFFRAFFFSIHTSATIGYGDTVPWGMLPNLLVTIESLSGLLCLALATSLLFARFSRPSADIQYSENALIAPYHGVTCFQFRIVNRRDSELLELQAKVILSRFEDSPAGRSRRFYLLDLERDHVAFFPLNWTVVHPINEHSPLHGWTRERLLAADAEFLILLTGIDESFAQTVHSRRSYTADEVVWGARFVPLIQEQGDGAVAIRLQHFDRYEVLVSDNGAAIPEPQAAGVDAQV